MSEEALLIIGSPGSGKTPLGDLIQVRGLGGRSCFHFDFGAWLRRVRECPTVVPNLDHSDLVVVERVLAAGQLLADSEFGVADKILGHYLGSIVGDGGWVVLNGLPRNVFQANAVQPLVTIKLVVLLECSVADAVTRIAVNADDERTGRTDGRPDDVAARFETYYRQTLPLLQHYRERGIEIIKFGVSPETTPEEIWGVLNNARLD